MTRQSQWVIPSKTKKGEEEVKRWQDVALSENYDVLEPEHVLAIVERLDVLWAEMAHLMIKAHVSMANARRKKGALKVWKRVGVMENRLRDAQTLILHATGFDAYQPEIFPMRPGGYRDGE